MVQRFASRVTRYESQAAEIGTKSDSKGLRAALGRDREEIKTLGLEISRRLKDITIGPSDRAQYDKIAGQFNVILKKFETVNQEAVRKEKEIVMQAGSSRTAGVAGAAYLVSDDPEAAAGAPDPALQKLARESHLTDYDVIAEQNEDILHLEEDLTSLSTMYVDLGTLVNEQQKDLDVIQSNVEKSQTHVEHGIEQVQKASVYQKKARKKMCCILILVLGVVGGGLLLYFMLKK